MDLRRWHHPPLSGERGENCERQKKRSGEGEWARDKSDSDASEPDVSDFLICLRRPWRITPAYQYNRTSPVWLSWAGERKHTFDPWAWNTSALQDSSLAWGHFFFFLPYLERQWHKNQTNIWVKKKCVHCAHISKWTHQCFSTRSLLTAVN